MLNKQMNLIFHNFTSAKFWDIKTLIIDGQKCISHNELLVFFTNSLKSLKMYEYQRDYPGCLNTRSIVRILLSNGYKIKSIYK
jgi:hypothetical protein